MKYFIRVGKGTGKEFKQEVEAEPLVIPEFEKIQLFIFEDKHQDGLWNISEVITGFALVQLEQCTITKDVAIMITTLKMQVKGLQWMMDNIKKYKPVAELPEVN
jgi:hypothetical protein